MSECQGGRGGGACGVACAALLLTGSESLGTELKQGGQGTRGEAQALTGEKYALCAGGIAREGPRGPRRAATAVIEQRFVL